MTSLNEEKQLQYFKKLVHGLSFSTKEKHKNIMIWYLYECISTKWMFIYFILFYSVSSLAYTLLEAVEMGNGKLTVFPHPITQSYKINTMVFKILISPWAEQVLLWLWQSTSRQNRIFMENFFLAFKTKNRPVKLRCVNSQILISIIFIILFN